MDDASLVEIPYGIRSQHIYIPGKTRHGKSTEIHALAYQDINNGQGVCVIDPKGDLVTSLLNWIPEKRKDDCIYIEPDHPIPLVMFDKADNREKGKLAGEMKHIVTKGASTDNTPTMNRIINDLIYTIFEANGNGLDPPATFMDIHDFLAYESRRNEMLPFVTSSLQEKWIKNFPNPKDREPTLNRMNDYIHSDYLRTLLGTPKPKLNIETVMNTRQILLVNLGGVDEISMLVGTLLISKIRQAAFRRHRITNQADRLPFYVYVDEFEFFQTRDFTDILSFAGGYGLCLTLANQFTGQLDTLIRQSIFGNVDSYIIFNVGPEDANYYKHIAWQVDGIGRKIPVDVSSIPKYHAVYRISGEEPVFRPTHDPPPQPTNEQLERAEYIRNRTIDIYAPSGSPRGVPSSRVPTTTSNYWE